MLQQTQVARVIPKFEAFTARFPTASTCAAVPQSEVVRMWAGLGYNRRAVNLHAAARAIDERHDGEVPDDLALLLALPGVGEYTARAILAFAFERDVGVLDTNAARVIARSTGRRLTRREAQQIADERVAQGEAWAWNQAMLDLGAALCTSGTPGCDRCPVAVDCAWCRDGRSGDDPAEGSAGVSRRQSRFTGSDRQGRGRLVEALRHGPVELDRLAVTMGWPDEPERARRVAEDVVRDGLAARQGTCLELA
jgi:A/G-specific adenine glycosylase